MPLAFIGVGSNLGDRHQNLNQAKSLTSKISGVQLLKHATIIETDPVGGPAQGKYLNTVWEIETDLKAEELLAELLKVEQALGRIRSEKNGPRTIDLDILSYGNEVLKKSGLEIPHPRMHERKFVLQPLAEIAPDFVHPGIRKTVKTILKEINESHS